MGTIPKPKMIEAIGLLADQLEAAEGDPAGPAKRQKIVVDLRCFVAGMQAEEERDGYLPWTPDDGPTIPDSWETPTWPHV